MIRLAYEFPALDTKHREKFQIMLNMLAPTDQYAKQLQDYGDRTLDRYFNAAQARIGAQFAPVMRNARSRLASSPLLADSGYSNRLNRQLYGAAFGDLSNAYSDAAADVAQSQLQGYQNLLNARMNTAQGLLGGVQKKKGGVGRIIGTAAGAGLGALVGAPQVGAAVGGGIGGGY